MLRIWSCMCTEVWLMWQELSQCMSHCYSVPFGSPHISSQLDVTCLILSIRTTPWLEPSCLGRIQCTTFVVLQESHDSGFYNYMMDQTLETKHNSQFNIPLLWIYVVQVVNDIASEARDLRSIQTLLVRFMIYYTATSWWRCHEFRSQFALKYSKIFLWNQMWCNVRRCDSTRCSVMSLFLHQTQDDTMSNVRVYKTSQKLYESSC